MIDPELLAKLVPADSAAWDAVRAWLSATSERGSPKALAELEEPLSGWSATVRAADSDEWARIEAGGKPPVWWPLVRTVTIDGWTSLDPLDALQGVENIRFGQRAQSSSLARLAHMPMLRDVAVGGLGSGGIDALPPLANLEQLSATAERRPLDFAARFPALRSLSLANSSQLEALPELPEGLVELDLAGCRRLTRVDGIDRCKSLRSLDLSRCDAVGDLAPLASLPAIERIRLDARRVRPLDAVGSRPTLRDLRIGPGEAVLDLRPVHRHPRLQAFGLVRCTSVEGLAGLELPALEELHVIRCNVAGLPELRVSEHLRVLDLEGLPGVGTLPPIASGHVLEYLRLVGMSGLPPGGERLAARRVVERS
jgi:hypothetical protein